MANSRKKRSKKESLLLKGHRMAFKNGLLQVKQAPFSSFITCLIIAMTLLLTTSLLLSLQTFKHIADSIHASNQVTFYLKPNSSEATIQAALEQLKQTGVIKEATYTSPEKALKELASSSEFKDVLVNIQDNPLPPVLLLTFDTQDQQQINDLVTTISQQPFVESVHINTDWFNRLFAIIQLGNRVTYLMTFLFSIGILFIISHTIAEATSKNYQEMLLLELIGATTAYIRRPFLYIGAMLGFGSGLACILLITLLLFAVKTPLLALLQSYNLPYPTTLQFRAICPILLFSTTLGWLGAWISFYKYANLTHN